VRLAGRIPGESGILATPTDAASADRTLTIGLRGGALDASAELMDATADANRCCWSSSATTSARRSENNPWPILGFLFLPLTTIA
jgi:hypothetical protein